jgi:hypothetical protein
MIRTQIQLPPEQYESLKKRAQSAGRSMADCVREAVALYLARPGSAAADFASVAGRFRPRPLDDLKPHDRQLVDAIQGRFSW